MRLPWRSKNCCKPIRATYAEPHRYATGMVHVLVNGEPVLKDGEHTGARPGRVLVPTRGTARLS